MAKKELKKLLKKGDITVGQIVMIILLLLGFALVLLVYTQLNWSGTIDREVCHQSIVFRGTLISATKDYVPLKCQTNKICITGNLLQKGNCEEFTNEKAVVSARVSNSQDGLEQIEKAYAQEILDCWSMMGEGKLSLFLQFLAETYATGVITPSCVICSRIAIDKKSLDKVDFSQMNLQEYMSTHLVPGKQQTYFQYMAGGSYSGVKLSDQFKLGAIEVDKDKKVSTDEVDTELGNEFSIDENKPKETAILFMQISAPEYKQVFMTDLATAGIGLGSLSLSAPKTVAKGTISALTRSWTWIAVAAFGVFQAGSVSYNRAVSASYCGDMSLGSRAASGCSVVRSVDYDVKNILEYCENIENIP